MEKERDVERERENEGCESFRGMFLLVTGSVSENGEKHIQYTVKILTYHFPQKHHIQSMYTPVDSQQHTLTRPSWFRQDLVLN